MREQMERVVYVTDNFATEPTDGLAKTLAEMTPGDPHKRMWFGQSGTAAVEIDDALRIADAETVL
jgi:taurine--2-oxoglutarate transaminase